MVTKDKYVGEMNPEQLWETTMNPETRKLIKITINDAEEAEKALTLCMGKDIIQRKEFILNRNLLEEEQVE